MEQDYNITPSGYIYGRDPKATVPFWNVDTLKSLNEEIDNLNTEINNLDIEIENLESEKQELQNTINNLELENQDLSTELSNYPDYMVGFKPFPEGTELNYTIPNNSIPLNDFINRFPNIICDKVNINFLKGKFGYKWNSLPVTLNLNELTILYPPETNGIVNYNSQPLVKKVIFKGYTIYSSTLYYYISVSKNPANLVPYYPKVIVFDQFGNNPSTHSLRIKLQFDSNNLLDSGSFNPYCLILDYGNLSLSKVNVKIEGVSNSYGKPTVQNLVDSGITIFVSDNQYDLFASDPNFSLFGNKLRRLSEYVESEWIT